MCFSFQMKTENHAKQWSWHSIIGLPLRYLNPKILTYQKPNNQTVPPKSATYRRPFVETKPNRPHISSDTNHVKQHKQATKTNRCAILKQRARPFIPLIYLSRTFVPPSQLHISASGEAVSSPNILESQALFSAKMQKSSSRAIFFKRHRYRTLHIAFDQLQSTNFSLNTL